MNYLTKEQLDGTKTYYRFIDVAVKLENGETLFFEKLPYAKKETQSVICQLVGMKKIVSTERIRESYRLKEKWA